jgi:hypothetical protein
MCVQVSAAEASPAAASQIAEPPVRAFHTLMPGFWGSDGRPQIQEFAQFIRQVLGPSGINVLVLEVGYNFQYHSVPRIGNPDAVGPDDAKVLLQACRDAGIKLIPQLNCLGHQPSGKGSLLGEYPQYKEVPGKFPAFLKDPMPEQSQGLSYCPNNPDVHTAVFALLDELAADFESDTVHVGMDEVLDIASSNCPLCKDKDPADLFGQEVIRLHDHLASKGLKMWMWGDRFIDAASLGYVDWGWASSRNYTYPAVDKVPKDITVCDWQYDAVRPSTKFLIDKGFPVIAAVWQKGDVALGYLALMRKLEHDPDAALAARARGIMLTTWIEAQDFIAGYNGRIPPPEEQKAEWQRNAWRAAAGSSAVLKLMAKSWALSDEELAKAVSESEAARRSAASARLAVWSGAPTDGGVGWVGPAGSKSTIAVEKGQGREGRTAVAFHAVGSGWTGCLWNWNGYNSAGTDLGRRNQLVFYVKATGQKPDSLDVGLGSTGDARTGQVSLAEYCADLWDGQWHEVTIPLADLYAKDKGQFDPSKTTELDINTWSPAERDFTLLIGDISFSARRAREGGAAQ